MCICPRAVESLNLETRCKVQLPKKNKTLEPKAKASPGPKAKAKPEAKPEPPAIRRTGKQPS